MQRSARVVRERLDGDADPVIAARWLRGEPRPVALAGAWSDGSALLTSHPLSTTPAADPFALLDRPPLVVGGAVSSQGCVGGGWFGWFGFGLARALEPIPPAPPRSVALPLFDLAFHDHVVRRDEHGVWWFEALWSDARATFLSERLACWRERLSGPLAAARPFEAGPLRPTGAGLAGHAAAVAETVARIAAGELSQANVCLRLEAGFGGDPLDLWVRAASDTRPAYAAYVGPGASGHAVLSLSPELFLRRAGRLVTTRPIKGTAPANADPDRLLASVKDRAENVMIVDLMRNDLGRVCSYGSIEVTALCELRPGPGVWHLESEVTGTLRPGVGDGELLRASFPPGSVTGAPKIQAIRTIHALEASAREAYCGAVGFVSPLAGLELNVAIRTLETAAERVWLGVGGGIVGDSSPAGEVAEALVKARGVLVAAGLALDAPTEAADAQARAPAAAPAPIAREPRPDPARGVIETVRIAGGRPLHWPAHAARLRASAGELGLRLPGDLDDQVAAEAAVRLDGGLRVAVLPDGIELTRRALPAGAVTRLEPLAVPGGLGAHKWADRRLIDAHSAGDLTPLLCDLDGAVLEAGYAAILIVTGETITAPPLDGRSLPSISRAHTLAAAARAGWTVQIRQIALPELERADAIVLTSSLRGPHLGVLDGGRPRATAAGIVAVLSEQRLTQSLEPTRSIR